MSINNLPIETGNYVNSNNNVENIVDILRENSGSTNNAIWFDFNSEGFIGVYDYEAETITYTKEIDGYDVELVWSYNVESTTGFTATVTKDGVSAGTASVWFVSENEDIKLNVADLTLELTSESSFDYMSSEWGEGYYGSFSSLVDAEWGTSLWENEQAYYGEEESEMLSLMIKLELPQEGLFPDKYNTLNTQPAKSGNMVGSDGNVYNIVDLLRNIAGIGDKIIVKSDTIPTAGEDYVGQVYQYVGTTSEYYTHGYIYECIEENSNYTWSRIDVQPGGKHNLGYYETVTDLQTAHPTGTAGDFALIGSTDTFWIWDTTTSAWVDSHKTDAVTSVNGQTGAVTVQETLVNQTNIKSVNGNTLLGSGNLELSTYLPYPSSWHTSSSYTTKQFCDDIAADTTTTVGKAYLGEVEVSDLPQSIANAEVVVEIIDGTTSANKVIVLSMTSGTTAPYQWIYTYWNGGSNVSGWKAPATIDDNSISSTVETWSASKLNSTIGDIESILETI